MARDTSVDIADWKKDKLWTMPPVLTDDPPQSMDDSFLLTQGIVYNIKNAGVILVQNISENQDDYLEYSVHGNPHGTWNRIYPGSYIKAIGDFSMLNRTHKHNCEVAIVPSVYEQT
jgi:hypothetical protein